MRRTGQIFAAAAATLVLGACGQHTDVHPTSGRGQPGETIDELPSECEGDARHCVVLTSYRGVNVYENVGPGGFCTDDRSCLYPPNRYGSRWQCVELFNRFFAHRYGTPHVPGHARDLLDNAAGLPGLEVHPNGGLRPPVPGDAVVFTGSRYGHVVIVTAVLSDEIHVVEQNGTGDGTNTHPYDAATHTIVQEDGSPLVPRGWIHATRP